jgi:hypothetical protein
MKSWPYRDRSRLATEASSLGAVLRGRWMSMRIIMLA